MSTEEQNSPIVSPTNKRPISQAQAARKIFEYKDKKSKLESKIIAHKANLSADETALQQRGSLPDHHPSIINLRNSINSLERKLAGANSKIEFYDNVITQPTNIRLIR